MRTMSAKVLLGSLLQFNRTMPVMYLLHGVPIPIVDTHTNKTSVSLKTRELDDAMTVGELIEVLLGAPPLASIFLQSLHNPEAIMIVRGEGKSVILKDLETNFH